MFQKVSVFIDRELRREAKTNQAISILGSGINQCLLLAGWVSQLSLFSSLGFHMDPVWREQYIREQPMKFLDDFHEESKVAISHLRRASRIEITIRLAEFGKEGFEWELQAFAKSAKKPFYKMILDVTLHGHVLNARHYEYHQEWNQWTFA